MGVYSFALAVALVYALDRDEIDPQGSVLLQLRAPAAAAPVEASRPQVSPWLEVSHTHTQLHGEECLYEKLEQRHAQQWTACSNAEKLGCPACKPARRVPDPGVVSAAVSAIALGMVVSIFSAHADDAARWITRTPATETPKMHRMAGLDVLRFFAAVHILENHFYVLANVGMVVPLIASVMAHAGWLAEWGWTHVGLFFMLSAFVQAHSTESRPAEGGYASRIFRAQCSWLRQAYPIYLFSMALGFGFMVNQPWSDIAGDVFLVKTWQPGGFIGTQWNTPTWFLSTLFALTFLHPVMYDSARCLGPEGALTGLFVCWGCSALPFLLGHGIGLNWFNLADPPSLSFRQQVALHPLSFWPVYVAGILMHRLFIGTLHDDGGSVLRCLKGGGATLASASLIALFVHLAPWRWCAWAGTGLLMPIWALLVFGLAHGIDPLARLMSPFALFGQLALPIYVLQVPIIKICGDNQMGLAASVGVLFAASVFFTAAVKVLPRFGSTFDTRLSAAFGSVNKGEA